MEKVLVGLSGGIDSSVAAYLLKKQGYDVIGATMLIWKKDSPYPAPVSPNSCYNPNKDEDIVKIKEIAEKIGIEHITIDCSSLYEQKVLDNFRSEYMSARTPNPCIWCNALIKFGAMVNEARKIVSFDYFATGHYARIVKSGDRYAVKKAVDLKKDQSYFLSRLTQEQLKSTLFPLGGMTKEDVRKIDVAQGFHKEGEAESQDFYGGDYTDLLMAKNRKGDIVFKDGKKLGEHDGFWHYTIGQRKGLGIAYSEPLYVIRLDSSKNQVVVGTKEDTLSLKARANNIVYMKSEEFSPFIDYSVKVRSTSPGNAAKVKKIGEDEIEIEFLSNVNAITPGQSAVIYDGDEVVASAIIE